MANGPDDKNRRKVLKSMAGAAAATPFAGVVSGLDSEEEVATLDELIALDAFQRLSSELGVQSIAASEGRVTRHDGATRASVPTDVGLMGVITIESVEIALLDVAEATRLPDEFSHLASTPDETRPLLFATSESDEIQFRRDATAREAEHIARKTGIAKENLTAIYESDSGGFTFTSSNYDMEEFGVLRVDGWQATELSREEIYRANVVTDPVTPDIVGCSYNCAQCLRKGAKCAGCCAVAKLGCIACIIWQCGTGASSCYDCYDCLS